MPAVRLFHVSDLHFGREDEAAVAWFADLVRAERPDAVVITGDLTMRARSAEYAAATAWLRTLDVPVTIEPGNHDLPYYNPLRRLFTPYKRYNRVERAIERPLALPGVWLAPLKTTARAQLRANWSWGVVSRGALRRALERLAACPADHLAIVTCHHPLIGGPAGHGETLHGAAALAALAEGGADAVLSGHVHDPFDIAHRVGGATIRLIGAGTLSERLRTSAPSFNALAVDQGRLTVTVREMAPDAGGRLRPAG